MKQLIEELKLYYSDTLDLSPAQDSVIFKYIITNAVDFASGLKRFRAGDTTSYYQVNNANYIYLVSDDLFKVVFDDPISGESVTITTQQFSYVNLNTTLSLELQPYSSATEDVIIQYLHGAYEET
jgi:hypothetical protein